ncbi:transporter [Methylibium sp. Root1272]|uniref:transporter n=1 Tax=Methylibium sp. Root1272 TaxID=1736441 RepID=UPI001F2CEEE0|nr:transporter [Methylibium sp. Root1272]
MKPLTAAAALLCYLVPAHADDGISTDRPDFVESSQVVGKGRFQLETGLARERSDDASGTRLRVDSTPTLLRLGVSDTVELRIETDGYQRSRSVDAAPSRVTRERGVADTSLGIKWHMQDGDQASGRPAIAWLLHVDVDTGSAAFRGNGLRPSLRVVGEWELADELSVGAMGGFAVDRNPDSGRFATGILAVTVGRSWTDRFRTFVELAGRQLASSRHGGSVVSFDVGTAYLLSPSVQVDAVVSRGITHTSPDWEFGAGLSIKF